MMVQAFTSTTGMPDPIRSRLVRNHGAFLSSPQEVPNSPYYVSALSASSPDDDNEASVRVPRMTMLNYQLDNPHKPLDIEPPC